MKKIVAIIGGIIALLGIFIGLIDQTMGLWQMRLVTELLGHEDTVVYFLSPFGKIPNSANDNIIQIESSVIIIISIILIIASISVILGGIVDKDLITIIGSIVLILGIGYFCYAIGTIAEIQDLLEPVDVSNYLFGTGRFSFVATFTYTWRLGNGLFIITAGAILAIVGSFLKSKR